MNGYVVKRFIAARLRGANDENKQRGVSHVKADEKHEKDWASGPVFSKIKSLYTQDQI